MSYPYIGDWRVYDVYAEIGKNLGQTSSWCEIKIFLTYCPKNPNQFQHLSTGPETMSHIPRKRSLPSTWHTEHQNKNKQIYLGAECQPCKHCVMYSVVIFFFGNMWRRLWPTILHWPMIRPLIFPFPFWLNGLQHQWLRPLDFLQSGLKMEKWCKD